jgi:hypothetical protein
MHYPAGEPFFVLPPREGRGQWHRFYRDANKYVGVFWNYTPAEVEQLKALRFVSVAEFKRRALRIKGGLKLKPPDAVFTRPHSN